MFKKIMAHIRSFFTLELERVIEMQHKEIQNEAAAYGRLKKEYDQAMEHLKFVTPLLSDRCPPDHINQLMEVKRFIQ